MPGQILAGTSIAVDYFFKDHGKTYFRFLTHVHSDCISGLTSSFKEYIHTSPFNAWVLKTQIKVEPKYIIQLNVGESHVIFDRSMDKNFSVTLIDANHCPGSVMFLFQGTFGNILYTGHFRYNPVMFKNQMLRSIVDNECLDYLYLDNTYAAEHCKFPSKKKALENILNLVRARPRHQIIVGLHKLGKEEVLEAIAVDVNELVHVSQQRLDVLNQLKLKKVFTTDKRLCRIFAVEMHAINTYKVIKSQINEGPILTLVLTGVYFAVPPEAVSPYAKSGKYGIYVQPYSDHSSHDELFEFVSFLKPNVIIPIIEQNIQEPIDLFWSHLWKNSVIPKRILDLAKNSSLLSPINETFSFSPPDGSHVPNEIIAENYQAMKCKNLISDSITASNKIVVKVSDNILKSIKNSSNELTDIHLSNNCLHDLNNTKSSSSSNSIISECCDKSTKNNAYKDTNREEESSHERIKHMNKTDNCNLVQFNNKNGNDTEICKDLLTTLVSTKNLFTYQLNSKSKDVSTNTDVDSYNTIVKQVNNESLQKSNTFQCNNYESKLNVTNNCNKGHNNCEFNYETIDKANFKVSIVVVGSLQDTTQNKDDYSQHKSGFISYNKSCSTLHDNETIQSSQRKDNDNNVFCEREGQLCNDKKETNNDIKICLVDSSRTNDNQIVTCKKKQDNCQEEIEIFSSFSNYDSVGGSQNSATENENVLHKQKHDGCSEKKEKYNDKNESVEGSRKGEANYENILHEQIQEKINEKKEKHIDKYESVASSQSSEVDYENVLHEQIHEKSNENKEKHIEKYESVPSSQSSEVDYENVLHEQIHEKSNENKEKHIDKYKSVASSQSSEVDYENVLHEQIHEKSNEKKEKHIDKYESVASLQSSEVDYENVLHEQIHEKSNEKKEKHIDKYESVASSQSSEVDYENVLHERIDEKSNENKEKHIEKYESVPSSQSSEVDYENVLHEQIHENKEKHIDKYKSVVSSQSSEVDYENVLHERIDEKSNENKEKHIEKYESVPSSQSSEVDYENVLHEQIHEKSNENKEKHMDKYKSVASSQSSEVDYKNVLHEQIHEKSNENKEKHMDKYKSVASSQSSEVDYKNVLHEETHEKCIFSDYNNSHHIDRLQNGTTDNKNQHFKEKYSSHSKYQLFDKSQNSIVDNENKNVLYKLNQETCYNNKNHNVSIKSYQKNGNLNKTQNISYEGNITCDKKRRKYDLCREKPIDRSYKNRTSNGKKNVIIEEFQTLNNLIGKDIEICKSQTTDTKKSIKGIQNKVCKSKDGIFVDISESQNEMQVGTLKSTGFVENCQKKSSSVDNLINKSHSTSFQVKQNCLSSLSNKSLQINHDYNQQLFIKDISSGFFVYKSENEKFHNTNHCDNIFEDSSNVISESYNHYDSIYSNTSACMNQKMSPSICCSSTNSDCTINCFCDSNDSSKLQTGIVSRNKRKMSMELEKNKCCNGMKNNFIPFGYKRRKIKNLNDERKLKFWNHLNCKKIFALPCFQKK